MVDDFLSRCTPGDWGVEEPQGPDILSIVANPKAEVYDWIDVAQIGTDFDGDRRPLREHRANAAIMAASKRMYMALAVVREAWDAGPLTAEHIAVVDKAMALARGE